LFSSAQPLDWTNVPYYRLGAPIDVAFGGIPVRISQDMRKCVVFFGVPGEHGIEYGGTGFLVVFKGGTDFLFSYIITAKHVAVALQQYEDIGFYVRANTTDGQSTPLAVIQKINWQFHPDRTVDLAVSEFGFPPDFPHDHSFYQLTDRNCVLEDGQVVCGDVCNLVGLFRLHAGSKRNVPIVHTGNIAALPDPNEPIPIVDRITGKIEEVETYLIEAQTLDGLSGAPVLIHDMVSLDIFDFIGPPEKDAQRHLPKAFGVTKFLGLYTGSWEAEPGKILAKDRNLRGGIRVPIGMGLVVPAKKIIDILKTDSVIVKNRKDYVERHKRGRAAVQDSAVLASPPASDANPNHREDFSSLLNAAMRKPESKD
jgi:hypothetical protein